MYFDHNNNNNCSNFERIIIIEVGLLGYANLFLLLPQTKDALHHQGEKGEFQPKPTLRQVNTTKFAQPEYFVVTAPERTKCNFPCRAVPLPFHLTVDFVVGLLLLPPSKDNELSPPRRTLTTYAIILQVLASRTKSPDRDGTFILQRLRMPLCNL